MWRVGMVGAGQLARMTHQAAVDLGIELVVLARSEEEPAVVAGARALIGAPTSESALGRLAAEVDVVTFDHEGTPAELVTGLVEAGYTVRPGAEALRLAQDKLTARLAFAAAGFPVPAFAPLGTDPAVEVSRFAGEHGWPVVIKSRRGGYDGRGVSIVSDAEDSRQALARMEGRELLVESHVELTQELAVVGVRSPSGAWAAYPAVGTLQAEGICRELVMPAPVEEALAGRAEALAKGIAEHISAVGIIAVELFLTRSGDLVVNEIAVRPHNSGHATIEAATTSQFHNHLRAVLDLPLGDTSLRVPAAAMVNVLGDQLGTDPRLRLRDALAVPGASVHLYGKEPVPGRKLGHVTAVGASIEEALAVARRCAHFLDCGAG